MYFDRMHVRGRLNLPPGPCILAGNHPSGLLDPLVMMSVLPEKQISSVAKHSLFSTPVVSFFLGVMRAVPVAKAHDAGLKASQQATKEERAKMNAEMFELVTDRLTKEHVSVCIFPEGTCHSTSSLKELKIGTAMMALRVASEGGSAVPIVPIGLNYTEPSGHLFRSSVLVDVGRPIEVKKDQIDLFLSGKEGEVEAAKRLTDALDTHLRHCTVTSPDWHQELDLLSVREMWPKDPAYSLNTRKGMVSCTVEAQGRTYTSSSRVESRGEKRLRERAIERGQSPPIAKDLQNQAARKAFMDVSGAVGQSVWGTSDEKFVDMMHIARRVYRPDGVNFSLAEFAALTNNFIYGFLRTGALQDPDFDALWQRCDKYASRLSYLGLTDKYVASHAIDSDTDGSRLRTLRGKALKEIAKAAVAAPVALVGALSHLPVLCVAKFAGERFGVDEHGDRSVEATMKLLAGVLSIGVYYPVVCALVYAATGSGSEAGLALAAISASGFTLTKQRPLQETLGTLRGQFLLLTQQNTVDGVRSERADLQHFVRGLVDKYAPQNQKGWWRSTLPIIVRRDDLQLSKHGIRQLDIPLKTNTRVDGERAVLTFKQKEDSIFTYRQESNRKALLWIPGYNDSFFHTHVLKQFVEEIGYDLYALDLRRCGRSRFSANGDELFPPENAHDSWNFEEYFEEIDAALRFINDSSETGSSVLDGGCGRSYDDIVLYGHSTGGLIGALYAAKGEHRNLLSGRIFNSPFWSFNLPWYSKAVAQRASALTDGNILDPSTVVQQGGEPSEYSIDLHKRYQFSEHHKSINTLTISSGWLGAVSSAQAMLRNGELASNVPALVLYTKGDVVLNESEIDKFSDYLVKTRQDGKDADFDSVLVEREIKHSEFAPSGHDVLAAPSYRRVSEAMDVIAEWTVVQFDESGKK